MNIYERTDLACEMVGQNPCEEGTFWGVDECEGFRVSRLRICTEQASKRMEKPIGTYVTVECGKIASLSERAWGSLTRILADELRNMAERLCGKIPDADFSVFVAGLGNAELTADAIGPKTVGLLTATRHLREHEGRLYREIGCSSLSALAPGVLGQTGIETLELLRGAVRYVKPDLVIVIDALAARSCERLASTIQISDGGISPGAGIGNHRMAINRETVGCPVMGLGVPTVVDSSTLVWDALERAGMTEGALPDALGEVLESGRSFIVSPRDCDEMVELTCRLLAKALDIAFGVGE